MSTEPRLERLVKQDMQRTLLSMPPDVIRSQLLKLKPGMSEAEVEVAFRELEQLKAHDPLASLQDASTRDKEGGQLSMMKLAPKFEVGGNISWHRQQVPALSRTAAYAGASFKGPCIDALEPQSLTCPH